jgi:hypothetical protein
MINQLTEIFLHFSDLYFEELAQESFKIRDMAIAEMQENSFSDMLRDLISFNNKGV